MYCTRVRTYGTILSGLRQPWSCTAASNLSMLSPKAKLSPIRLNSAIPTFRSLHHPQRIKLSMAFRLLPAPLQGRRLPQASPRWTQLPTFETSLNLGICAPLACWPTRTLLPGHPSVLPHEPPRLISPSNVKRYLINYPHLSDYGQTIFCLSFPSRDRATTPRRYEQFYFTKHVPYPQKINFEDAIRSD